MEIKLNNNKKTNKMTKNDLLKQQTSSESEQKQINKNETVIEKLDDTPFTLVKQVDGWVVTIGRYALTDKFETKQQAKKEAEKITWKRIMQFVSIFIEAIQDFNNNNTNK